MNTPDIHAPIASGNLTRGSAQLDPAVLSPAVTGAATRLNWILAQIPCASTNAHLVRERIRLQISLRGLVPKEKRGQIAYNLGCIALHQRRFQDAKLLFAQTLKILPNHTAAHCNLGYANERTQNLSQARSCYQKAGDLDPTSLLPRLNLVLLLQAEGKHHAALQALEVLYTIDPNNQGIMVHLCRFLSKQATTQHLMRIAKLTQPYPLPTAPIQLLECRALALSRLGQLKPALQVFEAILKRQANNTFARKGLIKVETLLSKSDAASFKGRRRIDRMLQTAFEQPDPDPASAPLPRKGTPRPFQPFMQKIKTIIRACLHPQTSHKQPSKNPKIPSRLPLLP